MQDIDEARAVMVLDSGKRISHLALVMLLMWGLAACGGKPPAPEGVPTETTPTTRGFPAASVRVDTEQPDIANQSLPTVDSEYQASMDARVANQPTYPPQPTPGPSIFDQNGDGWFSYDELRSAILAAIDQYQWSPLYPVTADYIRAAMSHPPTFAAEFQVGSEIGQLDIISECTWMQTWLDASASGDTELEATALNQMLTILPYLRSLEPSTTDYLLEIAKNAQLGDPSGVINMIRVNCASQSLPPKRSYGS
ncbi:MAG TPA: hypothetical protein PK819_04125 [Thermomicrobiales bacterium]|nr:hypothetical protein [Thermomicrobiales bacterium]